MKYTVLTGATGLLGSFLLKDLLQADVPTAVLIRSTRYETATQRIEAILRRFERLGGRPLPRPIIMESNLHESELGLSKEQQSWLSRNADTMIHNAASLSFVTTDNGEPYKSNVEGTRNVLELCRATKIRRFHHVSTAYVCGRRKGLILESELDDTQGFGNDYEKSKFTAETMVRRCPDLDSVTVFRPAIIVGDSVTGYTSTFHGFYAPMKILVPLVEPDQVDVEGVSLFSRVIGMNPEDRKNFVPVDWISRIITSVTADERLHGECYHLAAANRVPIHLMSRKIAEGIIRYKKKRPGTAVPHAKSGLETLLPLFREQMKVYQAYWRDDPEFDMTNTRRAVPQFPPIEMTPELLMVFIRYAIESRFGWPKPKPASLDFESDRVFSESGAAVHGYDQISADGKFSFGLCLSGPGGGDWTLMRGNDDRVSVARGLPEKGPLLTMNTETFQTLQSSSTAETCRWRTSWENGALDDWVTALETVREVGQERRTS